MLYKFFLAAMVLTAIFFVIFFYIIPKKTLLVSNYHGNILKVKDYSNRDQHMEYHLINVNNITHKSPEFLELNGTVYSNSKEYARAFITEKGKGNYQKSFRVADAVMGLFITEIYRGSVVISSGEDDSKALLRLKNYNQLLNFISKNQENNNTLKPK
jgi:hypothetical protein